MTKEFGREYAQTPILTVHVHPNTDDAAGLSDQDYISFLSEPHLMVMMICYQGGTLFAMKTSATPLRIDPNTVKHWIAETRQEIQKIWTSLRLPKAILAFNKAVCTEFGMTLYLADDLIGNSAHRIDVTQA